MPQLDTTKEARRVHLGAIRSLGLSGRARTTFGLSDDLMEVVRAGIRARHPHYTESEVTLAQIRMQLGADLFRTIFPDDDIEP